MKHKFLVGRLIAVCLALYALPMAQARERWSEEQARNWEKQTVWLVGCNYITSNAINQLEMWQAETFDPTTIDRELGWADGLGFNSVRVFLHDLLWKQDAEGFVKRLEQFLSIADQHHIRVDFVLFDSVWDPVPKLGKQQEPRKGLHNSGWVQAPGAEVLSDPSRHEEVKPYVLGLISHFKDDKRIVFWETMNEPDNTNNSSYSGREPTNKREMAHDFLQKVYAWAREADPSQPLTSGVWIGNWSDPSKYSAMEQLQFGESDVISFHSYDPLDGIKLCVEHLRRFNRPILCTEYMARPRGSTLDPVLGFLKSEGVAAYNWGFVAGKSNTIYPWDSWQHPYPEEPKVWFHDIFRADGTPYDGTEVKYIRQVTGAAAGK